MISDEIKSYIDNSDSIILLTHKNPDGDAVGSILAFYHMLVGMGKKVSFILNDIPYNLLKYFDIKCNIYDNNTIYDLAIVLDCSSKDRINGGYDILDRCKYSIAIDHHYNNKMFCNINYVDDLAAACALVIYDLFKLWNINFNDKIRLGITIGILTDTGGFSYSNLSAHVFDVNSDMMRNGIDIPLLYKDIINSSTMGRFLLNKIATDRLEFFDDNKIAFTYVTQDDFISTGANLGEHEGLVDIGRNIIGVEVSIFVIENSTYRVSFRSNGRVNVSDIASKFGGGGHILASGCEIDDDNTDIVKIKRQLINECRKYL